jgi:hypothetical protein
MADGVSSGCRTIGGARGAVVAVGVVAIAGAGRAGAIVTALLQRAKFEIEGIDFFVKIRGILDSMYNHFNSYGNYKHWTSFPEFVIGFLEKYEINLTTLKI